MRQAIQDNRLQGLPVTMFKSNFWHIRNGILWKRKYKLEMEQLFLVYCVLTYFNLEFFNEPQRNL